MTTTRKNTAAKKQETVQETPQEAVKAPEANEAPKDPTEAPESKEAPQEAVEAPKEITVVVVSKFIDKGTGETRNPGDVIAVTQERLDEILAAGRYVVNPA